MKQKIGIILVACFSFVLCLSLAACSFTDKSLYVGTWELQSSDDGTFDADTMELMQTLDVKVTLSLSDDDTGVLNYLGNDPHSATWKASSNTEGEIDVDGETRTHSLNEGVLTMSAPNGTSMTFAKVSDEPMAASAAANSAASSASASAAATSTATATESSTAAEAGTTTTSTDATANSQATDAAGEENVEGTTSTDDATVTGTDDATATGDSVATTADGQTEEGMTDEWSAEDAEVDTEEAQAV